MSMPITLLISRLRSVVTGAVGDTTPTDSRSRVKALRDQELALSQQAERDYARFVDRWKTRRPRGEARERLSPARNE